jgi:hypothetical protein
MIVKKPQHSIYSDPTDGLAEGIFGDCTDVPASIAISKKASRIRDAKKPKPAKRKPRVMPSLDINYDSMLPKEAEGLKLDNTVDIPVPLLKSIGRLTNARTRSLSNLLLTSATPAALSYEAASSYVKAVLSDGLKIDVDIDRGVMEVVRDLSRLDVIHYFVKRLKLPQQYKQQFLSAFITELSKSSLENLRKSDKSNVMSEHIRELEGVIAKRSNSKVERHKRHSEESEAVGPMGAPAVRKRRL